MLLLLKVDSSSSDLVILNGGPSPCPIAAQQAETITHPEIQPRCYNAFVSALRNKTPLGEFKKRSTEESGFDRAGPRGSRCGAAVKSVSCRWAPALIHLLKEESPRPPASPRVTLSASGLHCCRQHIHLRGCADKFSLCLPEVLRGGVVL